MANIWSMAHNGARSDQQHMTKVWLIWASLVFVQYLTSIQQTGQPTHQPNPEAQGGG